MRLINFRHAYETLVASSYVTFWCFSKCWLWQACWSLVITYFSELEWIRKNCVLIFIFNSKVCIFQPFRCLLWKNLRKWVVFDSLSWEVRCNRLSPLLLFILKIPHVLRLMYVNCVLIFILNRMSAFFKYFDVIYAKNLGKRVCFGNLFLKVQ